MKLTTFNLSAYGQLELETTQHHLMNLPLVCKTNHPHLTELVHQTFAHFTSSDLARPVLEIRLICHDPPRTALPPHPTPIYRTLGHLLYISLDPWNTAVVDYRQGFAFAFVTPEVIAQTNLLQEVFVSAIGLSLAQVCGGFVVLHAAAVVKQGQALTLIGSSGSGKSTLAYACVRQGFKVVAEDAVFVETLPAGLRYWGKPWPFRLLESSKTFFPELQQTPAVAWANGKQKLALEVEQLYPNSILTHSHSGPLVFLERREQPPRLRPVSVQEVAERLEIIWPFNMAVPEHFPLIYQRLLDLPAYALSLSGDPTPAVELLEQLVKENA